MTVHRWVESTDRELGIMVAFDEEPTEEALAVFRELADWIAAHPDSLRGHKVQLTEAEAAEGGDRQMERILALRRKVRLDG